MKVDQPSIETAHKVTAAEIIRNFGHWQQQALNTPLAITHHGRARVMLISIETYERLRQTRAAPQSIAGDIELLTSSMAEGFMQYDKNLIITNMNSVAEAYFGRRRSEMIGTVDLGNPLISSMMMRVLKTGETLRYEVDSKLFPGRRVSMRTFPYEDGIASLFVNITEQERMRRDAEKMAALKTALAGLKRVAIVKLDVRGRLVDADEILTELIGFTAKDLAETRLLNCVVPADRRLAQALYDNMAVHAKSDVTTVRVITKSGEERRIKIGAVPLMPNFVLTGAMLMLAAADGEEPRR